MNTPVRVGETIEGSRTMRNRPYPVLKCSSKYSPVSAAFTDLVIEKKNASYDYGAVSQTDLVIEKKMSLGRAARYSSSS